jgi:general secretion pathway protein B
MSYILDALKKAEQERGSAQLQTVASGRPDRNVDRGRWRTAAVVTILGLLALICCFLFYQWRKSEIAATAKQQEVESDPNVRAVPKAITPSAETLQERIPPPVSPIPELGRGSVAVKPPEIENKPIAPKQETAAHNEPAAQPLAAPGPAPTNPDSTKVSLRDAAAKMRVTMLMYSEDPAERMVFIDGKKYKEGESVQGRFLLEKIALEGVQLSYKGDRIFLHP